MQRLNGDRLPQTLQSYQFSKRNTPLSGKESSSTRHVLDRLCRPV